MKKSKDKIIAEVKRTFTSLIPFAVATKKGNEIMLHDNENWAGKEGELNIKNISYFGLNLASGLAGIIGILMAGAAIYTAYQTKTLDYRKWPEINEQIRQEQITQRDSYEKRVLDKAYNFFDLDRNGDISKGEFKKGIERVPTNTSYNNLNFYDQLNGGLELNEEHVENVREENGNIKTNGKQRK